MFALVVEMAERFIGLAFLSRRKGKLVGGEAFVILRRAREGSGARVVFGGGGVVVQFSL